MVGTAEEVAFTAVLVSMVVARDTLVSAVDIPLPATIAVATMADSAAMAGTVFTAGVAVTDGEPDMGDIQATIGAGDGVLELALGGRIGVGDTRMATFTVLRIMLPTPTIRRIALRATSVLPLGKTTLRHRIPT